MSPERGGYDDDEERWPEEVEATQQKVVEEAEAAEKAAVDESLPKEDSTVSDAVLDEQARRDQDILKSLESHDLPDDETPQA